MYILQIKSYLNAITCTIRTVSDDLSTNCKMLDDLVVKVYDVSSQT